MADAAPERALPSGTVTMVFTDIEGSTRLARSLGNRYQIVLADHHRVLREAWRAHDGQEIGTEGDSFFVVFRRARDAVEATVEAQRALAAHRWPEGADLRVRMGVHTGEPDLGAESYVGLGVHRAARIAAVAHGGQVLLSEATCAVLEPDAIEGVTFRDLGPQRLKDFAEPQHLFQLEVEGLQSVFPPLKTLAAQEEIELAFSGHETELALAAHTAVETERRRRLRRGLVVAALVLLATAGIATAAVIGFGGGSGGHHAAAGSSTNAARTHHARSATPRTATASTHTARSGTPRTTTAIQPVTTTSPPPIPATTAVTTVTVQAAGATVATTTVPPAAPKPKAAPAATRPSEGKPARIVLAIRFQPRSGPLVAWRLTCLPPGGTNPQPAIACAELAAHPAALHAVRGRCPDRAGRDLPRAHVAGRFRGERVSRTFGPGCGAKLFKTMHVFFAG